MRQIRCSVEILTRNSEATLGRCLESVKNFAEIIVLDGNSTDNTLDIARKYGAKICKQYETDESDIRITNFSEVRNKGLWLAHYDWFMFIDSDEYLSSEAVEEIRGIVESAQPSAYAFWQPRKYVLKDKVIECATTYPNQQIRFFHRAHAEEFIKPVHERIRIKKNVTTGRFKGFEYVPVDSLGVLCLRWKRYIEQEAAMYQGASRTKILKVATRQCALFLLYALRYVRNLFSCRGRRMPLIYEWTRHKYLLLLAWKLFMRAL